MGIDSIKHDNEKRPLIPSTEEAGAEYDNPAVQSGKASAAYPVNPVVHRGKDPELFWMNKYGNDDREDLLNVDIRSLYRHEHIAPETLIDRLYRVKEVPFRQLEMADLFGNAMEMDAIDKVGSYYSHHDDWKNRLIQGDSLLVMSSLLEREGLAGKVQCIYIDPPYGIKYGSNWQMRLNNRNVKDGADVDLSGEPEQIKAYRDTWELGVHSYLSYLRDRLLVAKELLHESGSCFIQISDENVHLVRSLMDEVFGSENFSSEIFFRKTAGTATNLLATENDFLLWYAKDKSKVKFRQPYQAKKLNELRSYKYVVSPDTMEVRFATKEERERPDKLLDGWRLAQLSFAVSQDPGKPEERTYRFREKTYDCGAHRHWKTTNPKGLDRLAKAKRLAGLGSQLNYIRYFEDFPFEPLTNSWDDTGSAGYSNTDPKVYVVQTDSPVIQRCMLMSTDPGDLVLDPTCGSGTTAYVAEQCGRRWITTDTSRIALNVAKTRIMTATFPYYKLYDESGRDIRQGFIYKKVPHITLKSIANDEPADEETLYGQPEVDNKRMRVAGPFTVETLQNFEPVQPEALDREVPEAEELEQFEQRIFEHMKSAGVKNGVKNECAVFHRIDRLSNPYLHAEGFYNTAKGERKAYIFIGPKFGTVSRLAVNQAVKDCRAKGDADWLIILGFSFESDINNQEVTTSVGSFEVTKARMHDDLMQDGLLKKDKKAASFVTIGEPDIRLEQKDGTAIVEICGLDIYDPIQDEVKPRDVADIAYWMVDDDYDGSNFITRQVFFCGSDDKEEFKKWKAGLSNLVVQGAKKKAENTLKIEIDDEAFARLYGHKSHPIEIKHPGQKIAVRVISQFGEESTKVLEI